MNIETKKRIKRFEQEIELLVMSIKPTMQILEVKFKHDISNTFDQEMHTGLNETLDKIILDVFNLSQALDNYIQSET